MAKLKRKKLKIIDCTTIISRHLFQLFIASTIETVEYCRNENNFKTVFAPLWDPRAANISIGVDVGLSMHEHLR